MRKPKLQVAIQEIVSGNVALVTTCEALAAKALVPGTVWGEGWTDAEARKDAAQKRAKHLAEGYTP